MTPTLKKLVNRAVLLAAVGFVVSQMLPSLADQLTPNPSPDSTISASPVSDSQTATESPSPSPSTSSSEPKPEITYVAGESPTAKAKIVVAPALFFRVPNSIQVDPRAKSVRFNSVALGGASNVIVCVDSTNQISIQSNAQILVDGQGSSSFLISGKIEDVLTALTSGQGLIFQNSSHISGTSATFRVSAVTKPATDSALCDSAQVSRFVSVTPLGIDLNLVKTQVDLGKK